MNFTPFSLRSTIKFLIPFVQKSAVVVDSSRRKSSISKEDINKAQIGGAGERSSKVSVLFSFF